MKLSVQGLNSHYGPAHILFDVALEVGEGEVVALLGRNGAAEIAHLRIDDIVDAVEGLDRRAGRADHDMHVAVGDMAVKQADATGNFIGQRTAARPENSPLPRRREGRCNPSGLGVAIA